MKPTIIKIILILFLIHSISISSQNTLTPKKRVQKETIKVSIVVSHLGQLNFATGAYQVEFFLSLTCPPEIPGCNSNFVVLNGSIISKDKVDVIGLKSVYKVKADVYAHLTFHDFPLDEHVLPIIIMDKEDGSEDIVFEADKNDSGVDDKVTVSGYDLGDWKIFAREESFESVREKYSMLHFNLIIKKPILTSALKTYFPATIILFIALLGLFLHGKNIHNRLSMGTAGLLASVMFHISSTSSLPTVSYLTRVDKYMLAIYSTLLVHIVLAVYSLTLEEEVGEDPVKIEHLKKVYKMIATYVPVYAAFLLSIVLFHIV